MAIVYASALKDARMTDVLDAIDAGSAAGKLKIYQSDGTTLLAVVPLDDPCASVTGGVLTLLGVPLTVASATATGTAAKATITDSDDNVVASNLTVGVSASDINLNSTAIVAAQPVTLTAGTITHG